MAVAWRPLFSPLATHEPAEGPHASCTCPLRTAMSVGSGGWEGQARPGHDHDWVVARVRPAVRRTYAAWRVARIRGNDQRQSTRGLYSCTVRLRIYQYIFGVFIFYAKKQKMYCILERKCLVPIMQFIRAKRVSNCYMREKKN